MLYVRAFYLFTLFSVIMLISGLSTLSGCATMERHEFAAKLGVQYAMLKYVERKDDPEDTKARIREHVSAAKRFLDQGTTTLALLKSSVIARLDMSKISVADQLLIYAVIDAIVFELQDRIKDGVIRPEQLYKVNEVLDWILEVV